MSDWLELELAHHLGAVEAPDELTCPQVRTYDRPRRRLAPILAIAAGVAVLLLAVPRATAIRSSDPARVNHWLYACAGIDLPIPGWARGRVQGARLVERDGMRVAEVSYQVGGKDATLLIAPARVGRDAGWKQHGAYAIFCPESPAACGLCHVSL